MCRGGVMQRASSFPKRGSASFTSAIVQFVNFTMNSATCDLSPSERENPESSLQKCISLLKAAKNDTERFAALLLVTQLVNSNAADVAGRRELFDAIGFKFINRLLSTRSVPIDCPKDVYQSLALTILASFSTDEELCSHDEMISKIPLFLATISAERNDVVVADSYQIIASLACSSTGCRHLVKMGAITTLCDVLCENDEKYSTKALEVLLRTLNNNPRVVWQEQREVLLDALNALSKRFKEAQDSTKFELCNYLVLFLSGAEKSVFEGLEYRQWLADIYSGLHEILQSKISSSQRDPAICLVSVIIDLVGMDWMIAFSGQDSPGLFILSVTIASVEIRMILDGKTSAEIVPKAMLLTSCYNVVENAINFAIVQSKNEANLSTIVNGNLSKVYSLATESIHSIVLYLNHVAKHEDKKTTTGQNRVVISSVRVLCAWMSEETSALQEDVYRLLPFLLKLGKESLATEFILDVQCDEKDVSISSAANNCASLPDLDTLIGGRSPSRYDIIRFLLPPLCHISADDKMRKIFIENEGLVLLSKYFFRHWNTWNGQTKDVSDFGELETCLITLLGIFLNIIVTEPELVTKDEAFQEIGQHALTYSSQLLSAERNVIVLINLVVLGLMFVRNHVERGSRRSFYPPELSFFLKNSIYILKEASYSTPDKKELLPDDRKTQLAASCKDVWDDISELWFIGVQVLLSLSSSMSVVKELLEESGWHKEIVGIVNKTSQENENSGEETWDNMYTYR